MIRPTRAVVDLEAVRENLQRLRGVLGFTGAIIAVVKANAAPIDSAEQVALLRRR